MYTLSLNWTNTSWTQRKHIRTRIMNRTWSKITRWKVITFHLSRLDVIWLFTTRQFHPLWSRFTLLWNLLLLRVCLMSQHLRLIHLSRYIRLRRSNLIIVLRLLSNRTSRNIIRILRRKLPWLIHSLVSKRSRISLELLLTTELCLIRLNQRNLPSFTLRQRTHLIRRTSTRLCSLIR